MTVVINDTSVYAPTDEYTRGLAGMAVNGRSVKDRFAMLYARTMFDFE